MLNDALALALAFAIGSVPFSWLIARYRYGIDLRVAGDGNVGAGNLMALAGAVPGVAAILLDIAKGAAASARHGAHGTPSGRVNGHLSGGG